MASSGWTPRCTVSTRWTSAQPSTAWQRRGDHSSRHTFNISTQSVQESVPAVLQPLGALAQAARAAIRTAPVDKRRSSKQHPSAKAQQLAANTSTNSNINSQSSNTGGGLPSNAPRKPCKNCKSTSHGTKWCPSTKCFEKNCGKTLASADERKIYFIQEYGHLSKPATPPLKSSLKDS